MKNITIVGNNRRGSKVFFSPDEDHEKGKTLHFVVLGLQNSGKTEVIHNIVENCSNKIFSVVMHVNDKEKDKESGKDSHHNVNYNAADDGDESLSLLKQQKDEEKQRKKEEIVGKIKNELKLRKEITFPFVEDAHCHLTEMIITSFNIKTKSVYNFHEYCHYCFVIDVSEVDVNVPDEEYIVSPATTPTVTSTNASFPSPKGGYSTSVSASTSTSATSSPSVTYNQNSLLNAMASTKISSTSSPTATSATAPIPQIQHYRNKVDMALARAKYVKANNKFEHDMMIILSHVDLLKLKSKAQAYSQWLQLNKDFTSSTTCSNNNSNSNNNNNNNSSDADNINVETIDNNSHNELIKSVRNYITNLGFRYVLVYDGHSHKDNNNNVTSSSSSSTTTSTTSTTTTTSSSSSSVTASNNDGDNHNNHYNSSFFKDFISCVKIMHQMRDLSQSVFNN